MKEEAKDYSAEEKNGFVAIRDWSPDERPREKLSAHGPEVLSDSELLAILINTGTHQISAFDLAKNLLSNVGSLSKLATCDYSEFKTIKGLGPAKAITLAAAFEIGKRIKLTPLNEIKSFRSPEDIAKYYIPRLSGERKEFFKVILLNTANQILREVNISEGSLNASIVHPREVFRFAITESAASVILIHNHPSGCLEPSKEDINLTKQLVDAGNIIGIKVLDHIIIAGGSYTSLLKRGFI